MLITRRNLVIGAAAAAVAGGAIYAGTRGSSYDAAVQSAWRARSFGDDLDLRYLVHYAVLAANSHNTQPWRFSGSNRNVNIRPDFSRATPIADRDNHHVYASLGCACENLMLAAMAAGKSAEPHFTEIGGGQIEVDIAGTASGRREMFDAILARQCTRSDYDGRAVSVYDLKALEAAAKVKGCRVVFISDKTKIEQALELVIAANTVQVEDPAFAEELLKWLRFSSADAIETRDGLYAECAGNPALPAWLGRILFGFAFKAGSENQKYATQIRSSSGLAVFITERDDKAHWVQAGRSYQRFALRATLLGLKHAFINQPVEIPHIRRRFAKWLGIGTRRPDLVLRYGYAPPMPKSLRRPVEDVII